MKFCREPRVGSTLSDNVGQDRITVLTNGNYVINSPNWNCTTTTCTSPAADVADVGAVTWRNGTLATSGHVSSSNSLVGSTASDKIGQSGVHALTNGNYVVRSFFWDCTVTLCPVLAPVTVAVAAANVGAVTFGNGTSGTSGHVSATNSLVGTTLNDVMGDYFIALTNGNYVTGSKAWNCTAETCPEIGTSIGEVGAVAWGSGTAGISGYATSANSLVGTTSTDFVGGGRLIALTNGNYVVLSPEWNCTATSCPAPGPATDVGDVGAATWCNGSTGRVGYITSANSMVGSSAIDRVGESGATALSNGHYVIKSPSWNCTTTSCPTVGNVADVGAATWGNGSTGATVGHVSAANSLVGSSASDGVSSSGIVALTNGNYVVKSPFWNCTTTSCPGVGNVTDVGSATWGKGDGTTFGHISSSNSLVGSTASDGSTLDIKALTNGNYIVNRSSWDCTATSCPDIGATVVGVGAVTWGNGTSGTSGFVSASNSLVGSTASDNIGGNVATLTNGNYVVITSGWDCTAASCPTINAAVVDVGAATWGNGSGGTVGHVSASNSLVGSTASDQVGLAGVNALTNGNYLVRSHGWDCTATSCPELGSTLANVGAATWGSGTSGITGHVSSSNSMVGKLANDQVGSGSWSYSNGNVLIRSNFLGGAPSATIFMTNGAAMTAGYISP